jgi:hypothetical protein
MTPFKSFSIALLLAALALNSTTAAEFRAGAVAVDITPQEFPVIVNGGFLEKQATKALDPLHARALVLDAGKTLREICALHAHLNRPELLVADDWMPSMLCLRSCPAKRRLAKRREEAHTKQAPSGMMRHNGAR